MKLNKLKINSYGKLKNKEIQLDSGINIISGENESGKSTLLSFILSSFYGVSKSKRGKELSELEKYTPWIGDEFSGRIEYELDNSEKYEVFRDFKKKNPKIFNSNAEEISKNFNIDKNKGNEFFYEQTKVDEELFLSTLISNQQEIVLGKNEQNLIIQKIANLVGTGDDKVSYKKAIDRINKRQLDEIGTQRSREKPINVIEKKIEKLEDEKRSLEKYEDLKYEIEENKNKTKEDIIILENKHKFLTEIKLLSEREKLEKEKIKVKEKIKNKNLEKNEILNKKLNELDDRTKIRENKNTQSKISRGINILFILLIIINILQFIFIENNTYKYIFLLTIPIFLVFYIIFIKRRNKKQRSNKKAVEEKINSEKNNLINQIEIIEKSNVELQEEISRLKSDLNLSLNLEKRKIKSKYAKKLGSNYLKEKINLEQLNSEIQKIQNEINGKKVKLHTIEIDKKNIENKLEELSKIEEELVNNNSKKENLETLNSSMELAKNVIEYCYENMKDVVTPRFTHNLSENISEITNGKYDNVKFNDETGLIVETETGNYMPASRLSIGTIDQLYLSLRLSMIKNVSVENMPIILDESFAYFDSERLKNILIFLNKKYKEHQIIIFTCTNREKEILKKLKIKYNSIEL